MKLRRLPAGGASDTAEKITMDFIPAPGLFSHVILLTGGCKGIGVCLALVHVEPAFRRASS